MRKSAWFFAIFLAITLALIIPRFAPGKGETDFIDYWTGSRLMIQGQNPYDVDLKKALHIEALPEEDLSEEDIVEAWNPPWLLMILIPVAIFPFKQAVVVWVFLNTLLIVLALVLAWKLAGKDPRQVDFLFVLAAGFLFGNTISLLRLGQITAIVLVSLLLGLFLISRKKDLAAGMALALTTIKPHLVFLALTVLLLWAIRTRRFKIIVGMLIVFLLSGLATTMVHPGWFGSYLLSLSNLPYHYFSTSTFGGFIAAIWDIHIFRYAGILLILLAIPLAKNLRESELLTTINLALVISLPFSPYGFNFDHILLLPAVVQLIAWVSRREHLSRFEKGILAALIAIYALDLWMMTIPSLLYAWFFWIAFAIMIVYLISWNAQHGRRKTA